MHSRGVPLALASSITRARMKTRRCIKSVLYVLCAKAQINSNVLVVAFEQQWHSSDLCFSISEFLISSVYVYVATVFLLISVLAFDQFGTSAPTITNGPRGHERQLTNRRARPAARKYPHLVIIVSLPILQSSHTRVSLPADFHRTILPG